MRANVLRCFVLLLLVTACAGSAGEEPIDATGTIAFVSGVQRGSTIFVASSDGTERRQLTSQSNRNDEVHVIALSPDGSEIAYSRVDNAFADLFVVRLAGGEERRLTRSSASDGNEDWTPAWSPDGRKIAFDLQNDGSNWISVVNADGTGLRRLTPNYNWHPVWSPGGRIAYVNFRGIWVVNPDGSGRRLLARVPFDISGYQAPSPLAWSPDGTQIAFSTGSALWVMDADGQHRRKLYGDPNGDSSDPYPPVWSPDGTTLAFAQFGEILVLRADGSGLRKLTDDHIDWQPTWSPDGRALAFLRGPVRGPGAKSDIYVMNADGTGERNLSETPAVDSSPVWSPAELSP